MMERLRVKVHGRIAFGSSVVGSAMQGAKFRVRKHCVAPTSRARCRCRRPLPPPPAAASSNFFKPHQ